MHGPLSEGKFSVENLPDTPRMMGEADVALVDQILAKLPPEPRLIEFGPWLGGVSERLARRGELHVVDRFQWSELNAKNYPDVLPVGQSFRPLFEARLAQQGLGARIHQSEIEDFKWSGAKLDFCLIDAPRSAEDLLTCLRSIGASLAPSSYVLVKHGLNAAHLDMLSLIDVMIALGWFGLVKTEQPNWCNIAVLHSTEATSACMQETQAEALIASLNELDSFPESMTREALTLRIGRFAHWASEGHVDQALKLLKAQPVSPDVLAIWDVIEPQMVVSKEHEGIFAAFAELFCFHHGSREKTLWAPADESPIWAMRHAWLATEGGGGLSIETLLDATQSEKRD